MFINDGKSLFGNIGLVISIIILITLLFFSYNKCMAPATDGLTGIGQNHVEAFNPTMANSQSSAESYPPPQNIRVNISGGTVTLNFTVDISTGNPIPTKFMVVLVQYDSNLKPTGNNKFYISNEYKINTSVSSLSSNSSTTGSQLTGNNICELINGVPTCQYVFNNLDMIDTASLPFYYKIGISAVYDSGNSAFTTPYNIINQNHLFTLTSALDTQNNQFADYIKYKQMQSAPGLNAGTGFSSTTATADGQYELIKSQLGGYPSNLVMDSTSAKQNLLSDLVDRSMSGALLNVNVSTPISNNAV